MHCSTVIDENTSKTRSESNLLATKTIQIPREQSSSPAPCRSPYFILSRYQSRVLFLRLRVSVLRSSSSLPPNQDRALLPSYLFISSASLFFPPLVLIPRLFCLVSVSQTCVILFPPGILSFALYFSHHRISVLHLSSSCSAS